MHPSASRAERFLSGFLCSLALIFLALVAVLSLLETSVLRDDNPVRERVVYASDSPGLNLLLLAASLAGILLLGKWLSGRFGRRGWLIVPGICALLSLVWVMGVQVNLLADSQRLVTAAEELAVHQYASLTDDCYFQHYPFQLGYVFYGELWARLLPQMDLNLTLQVLNCLWLALVYAALLQLAGLLCPNPDAVAFWGILALLCMPCALYTVYAYGTLPSMALCGWALVFFLRMGRFPNPRREGLLCMLCLSLSILFKLNSLIMAAALGILALLRLLFHRQYKPLLVVLAAVLLAQASSSLITMQYARRSGTQLSTSTPMVAWMAMGLQESEIAPGWYNHYVLTEFDRLDHDEKAMTEAALASIGEQMDTFAGDPVYTLRFFMEKLASQWNDPTYGSLWLGKVRGGSGPLKAWGEALYGGTLSSAAHAFMNGYQQLVLVLALAGVIGAFREKSPEASALPLFLLGGAAYHMLFEAKSQYILMYFVFLLPLAARGLSLISAALTNHLPRLKRKRGKHGLD